MTINLIQLEFIVEIAKVNNISKASNNLHVSQSGISQSITNLEEELGIKIFNRSRAGVFPTVEGEKIIAKAQAILDKIEELKRICSSNNFQVPIEIKISLTPGFIVKIQEAIASFKKDFPHVNIIVNESISTQIIHDVINNESDLGLIGFYRNKWLIDKELTFQRLFKTMIKVCVGKNSPLALNEIITHEELISQPIVLYNSETFNRMVAVFEQKYGALNILYRTNNFDVIKKSIIDTNAVTFLTDVYVTNDPDVQSGDIIPLDFSNFDKVNIDYGWIHSKKRELSEYAIHLMEYMNPIILSKPPHQIIKNN